MFCLRYTLEPFGAPSETFGLVAIKKAQGPPKKAKIPADKVKRMAEDHKKLNFR